MPTRVTNYAPSRKTHTAKNDQRASTSSPVPEGKPAFNDRVQKGDDGTTASAAFLQTLLVGAGWSHITHATHVDDESLLEVVIERTLYAKQHLRLSAREFAVLELSASGLSSKEVGTALSVSAETSRGTLARASRKLGLKNSGLVPLFWAALKSPSSRPLLAGGCERFVFERRLSQLYVTGLSKWERELALTLILGKSNQQIALQRRVSVRTVANQLHALFRKLRVASRGELAAVMLGSRTR